MVHNSGMAHATFFTSTFFCPYCKPNAYGLYGILYESKYALPCFSAGVRKYIVMYTSCGALCPGSISEVHEIDLHNAILQGIVFRPAIIIAYGMLPLILRPEFCTCSF